MGDADARSLSRGRQADALRAYQRARTTLVDELGIEPGPELRAMEGAVLIHDPALELEPGIEEEPEPANAPAPYKGLSPFEREDHDVFFGRDAIVAALTARLQTSRFVALVGPSGSGKSSVLRAGVLPLATGPATVVTPASDPLPPRDSPLLVVDQFEEIFTLGARAIDRRRFVDAIVELVTQPEPVRSVVIGMRADFFGRCGEFPEFARLLESGTVILTEMGPESLRAAIEEPARVANLRLEPNLADVILADVVDEPGALPLLSHALLETWKRRRRRVLTVEGYRDAGGARGAIAQTAERVFHQLDPRQQALAHHVFLRLTASGDGSVDTKRRAARVELATSEDAEAVDTLLGVLADARLVTLHESSVEVAHEALIREWPRLQSWLDEDRDGLRLHRHLTQASHEWDELGRDDADLYRGTRLTLAHEWMARSDPTALNDLEREFLAASDALAAAESAEHEAQLQRRERDNRRLRTLVVTLAILVVVALIAGTVAVVQRNHAAHETTTARAARDNADIARLVAESTALQNENRYAGTLLALEANSMRDDAQTRGALLTALVSDPRLTRTLPTGTSPGVWPVPGDNTVLILSDGVLGRWSVDTRTQVTRFPGAHVLGVATRNDGLIAVADANGTISFYDRDARPQGASIHVDGATFGGALAFSPDGTRLAFARDVWGDPVTRDAPSTVGVYDVASRRPIALPLGGHTSGVSAVAFSPDGKVLATGGNDTRVVLHDTTTGATLQTMRVLSAVWRIAFDPRGSRLVVGSNDPGLSIFDATTGQNIGSIPGPTQADATFSRDSSQIAVGGNGAVVVRDAQTFVAAAQPFDAQTGTAHAAYLADGRLVVGGTTGPATVWSPTPSSVLDRAVPGAPSYVFPMPDDKTLVVPDLGDSVTLVDATTLRPIGKSLSPGAAPARTSGIAFPTAFAASYYDPSRIAVLNRSGRMQLYDVPRGNAIGAPFETGVEPVYAVFSRDMREVAVGGSKGEVVVVDLQHRRVRTLASSMTNYVLGLAFEPNGDLAAGDLGHVVMFTNLDQARPTVRDFSQHLSAAPFGMDLSPDGTTLAIGEGDNIGFYDVATMNREGPLVNASRVQINWIAYNRAGDEVIASDTANAGRLIDAKAHEPIGPVLTQVAGTGSVFSHDGKTIGTQGPNGGVLMSVDPAEWRAAACALAGRNLSAAEWTRYLPGRTPHPICPQYPT